MRQSTTIKRLLRRKSASLILVALLSLSGQLAWGEGRETTAVGSEEFQPRYLLALADPPEFLCNPPSEKEPKREEGAAITPFIGSNQALTLLPTPERPAITASHELNLERPEVTAGVNVNLGTFKFNLGYTLPASKVDSFVRPLGVELEPGSDVKRFSLGVKIPF